MTISETMMAQIRRHGLTAADKTRIAAEQDGCGLCGRNEPGRKGWVIDHDRSCCPGDASCLNCRRAVLCQWCNNALGYAFDNPTVLRRMADYLELGTRMHPTQVWRADQFTDQSTDQTTDSLTESVDRPARPTPTDVTDETDEETTNPPLTTETSVPHARISSDRKLRAERRRYAHAAATPSDATRPSDPEQP